MQCWNRYAVNLCNSAPFSRRFWAPYSCSKLFVGGFIHFINLIWFSFPSFPQNLSGKFWFRITGLSYDTNETVLKDAFQQHEEVIEAKVISDHVCGKSKGYGFVQLASESAASIALEQMNGQLLDGRTIQSLLCTQELNHCLLILLHLLVTVVETRGEKV